MSPVEFNKMLCHPVDFKGQGPLCMGPTRGVRGWNESRE